MSRYLLEDIADIYSQISESQDPEIAELVEDIIATVSLSKISEGYSARGAIAFLAYSSEQDILEYYLNSPVLSEEVLSEAYVIEQLEILDEAIPGLGLLRGAVKGGLGLAQRVATAGAGAFKGGGGIRSALGAMGTSAVRATKQGVGALTNAAKTKLGGAVNAAKGLAQKALPTLGKIGKIGAIGGGLGLGTYGAYKGAQALMGGGDKNAKPAPSGGAVKDLAAYKAGGGGAKSKKTGMGTADVENLGRSNLFKAGGGAAKMKSGMTKQQVMDIGSKNVSAKAPTKPTSTPSGGSSSGGSSSPSATAKPAPTPTKPAATGPAIGTTKGGTKYQIRTPTRLEMDRSKAAGGGEQGVKAAVAASQPTTGSTNAKIDTKAADAALAAENERLKKQTKLTTQKESYDAYDLVLEYLLSNGHADTIAEAQYLMIEMDSEMIGDIVENRAMARDPEGRKSGHSKQPDPSKAGFTGIGNMSIAQIQKMNARIEKDKKK